MANEELIQRGYLASGSLKGDTFGDFELLNIGATSVKELVSVGVRATPPASVDFPFAHYKAPKKPIAAKPDRVFLRRVLDHLVPVGTGESKAPGKHKTEKDKLISAEQALYAAAALGVNIGITSDGTKDIYIDVKASLKNKVLEYFDDQRDFNPAVLSNLLAGDAGVTKDPKPLAETTWQLIWHATKAEPKECLLTFVELFLLKFLSDNLPTVTLPEAYRFYFLLEDPATFISKHGMTAIEYYVKFIRPKFQELFPIDVPTNDSAISSMLGLVDIKSPTSIINGFAFYKSDDTLSGYNRTFLEILDAFKKFGPLTAIDPEFKLRLYETFLRRSARQQKLGQFFTPRNVVRPMIRMAQLSKLPDGATVLDPAAGVGGFVLEPLLFDEALPDNIEFVSGKPKRRIRTIGLDVDLNLHMLAKANMLIHLAEAVRNPAVTVAALNQSLSDTFVVVNRNDTLGSLEYPPRDTVDVILTNPPYVTQGSAIYKKEIAEVKGMRNGVDLRDYYDNGGLGVEALFIRYISGALKPGGRAFIIVPLGMLNRTEPRPKSALLRECNILASIQLPRNTFFNTSQKTYILVIERRHTKVDPRPPIFCAIARSIGETLDWQRIPSPDENDLDDIASAFVGFSNGDDTLVSSSTLIRIAPADDFTADDRWDVTRFWSDDELVELGERESAVSRMDFVNEARQGISEVFDELKSSQEELDNLTHAPMANFVLSNKTLFNVRSGTRVRGQDIRQHPGEVPIFSCFRDSRIEKGRADREWLESVGMTIEDKPIVTVNANGASVGKVYVRDEICGITDDVIIIDVLDVLIDLDFLAVQLRSAVAAGGFLYEAKLFVARVKGLTVSLPIRSDGSLDIEHQKKIAAAVKRFDNIRLKLSELGKWGGEARIA
ncbi:N-6 DNA methylase [Pararhizobium antarcticum]|uniref:DNA methylase adenine-specific domain-containing protein n=1 Tax=Pararhizobium antarcticum TaxID=1798805 RepID=A0A657LPW5_9HYPH|nr:N-6 DNA methylase [Pararhizobium antarcticum]OJF93654.1 hypothetical protein AX760_21500 [Pararhizobium antarcticum]